MQVDGGRRLNAMHYIVAIISGLLVAVLLFIPLAFVVSRMFDGIYWMATASLLAAAVICLTAGFSSFSATLRHYRGSRPMPGFPVITQATAPPDETNRT